MKNLAGREDKGVELGTTDDDDVQVFEVLMCCCNGVMSLQHRMLVLICLLVLFALTTTGFFISKNSSLAQTSDVHNLAGLKRQLNNASLRTDFAQPSRRETNQSSPSAGVFPLLGTNFSGQSSLEEMALEQAHIIRREKFSDHDKELFLIGSGNESVLTSVPSLKKMCFGGNLSELAPPGSVCAVAKPCGPGSCGEYNVLFAKVAKALGFNNQCKATIRKVGDSFWDVIGVRHVQPLREFLNIPASTSGNPYATIRRAYLYNIAKCQSNCQIDPKEVRIGPA